MSKELSRKVLQHGDIILNHFQKLLAGQDCTRGSHEAEQQLLQTRMVELHREHKQQLRLAESDMGAPESSRKAAGGPSYGPNTLRRDPESRVRKFFFGTVQQQSADIRQEPGGMLCLVWPCLALPVS